MHLLYNSNENNHTENGCHEIVLKVSRIVSILVIT